MITGRDALFSVEQAITQVRANESQLDGALRSAMAEAERLRGEEAEGFRMLARIKLDAMARDQVIGDIDATERRALGDDPEAPPDARGARAPPRRAAGRARQAPRRPSTTATRTSPRQSTRSTSCAQRTAERIKADAAWQAAKAAVDAAEKIAANADQKAAHAEADLAAKGKPYEDDPLFIYLWQKKHGQAEDRSGYLVRFFDRKVAVLVGYQDARANYAMLQEIPARLREHAKGKHADLDAAKAQLADVERRALVADGVEAAEARVERADAVMKAAEEAVAKTTAELQQIEAEREREVGSGEDSAYSGAIDLLAQALAREDLNQLYQEALQTPAKEDEQAIEAISQAREMLAEGRRGGCPDPCRDPRSWRSAAASSKARVTARAASVTTIRWEHFGNGRHREHDRRHSGRGLDAATPSTACCATTTTVRSRALIPISAAGGQAPGPAHGSARATARGAILRCQAAVAAPATTLAGARKTSSRAHPDRVELGCALDSCVGACPFRKTGNHFSGTCANRVAIGLELNTSMCHLSVCRIPTSAYRGR